MSKRGSTILMLALAVAIGSAGLARADCYHNGSQVPEGARVGGLVCVNGQWQSG